MEYPQLITPVEGQVYHNRCGSDYLCERRYGDADACMVRIPDGWTCVAHRIRQYTDGTIEWDSSTGGYWPRRPKYTGRAEE